MSTAERIRRLRPPKPVVDPYVAHGSVIDEERRPDGTMQRALTLFLAGAECPFTCSFCDLWRFTIDGPTPPGALPRQIETLLATLDAPRPHRLKLYNASNFFDPRAVPAADLPRIAALCAPFRAATVESHANTVGPAALDFAERLGPGCRLEVAMGLESIHPKALRLSNKRLDLRRFDSAARFLLDHDVDLRVFVLLGAPYVPAHECVEWTVRGVAHAAELGASVVAIIPVRGGNGEMERLRGLGHFTPPNLSQLEDALAAALAGARTTVVTADLWDVAALAACETCRTARVERLRVMNRTGRLPRPVACACAS